MAWLSITLTVLVLAGTAWLLKPVANKTHLPYPALLVAGGFIISQLLTQTGFDSGLRWHSFHDLVYYGLLPLLIYEAAFRLKADAFFNNMLVILLLSIPVMLISVLLSAGLLFLGIGNETTFPFIAALITAALLAANDPTAVIPIIERLNAPPRFVSILKGESLFNSILALVFVSLALNVELADNNMGGDLSLLEGFILFVQLFSGGVLTGLLCGLAGWLLMHYSRLPVLRGMVSLVVAYGTFLLAETLLSVSGIVAVLVAGLVLNAYAQRTETGSKQWLDRQWHRISHIASISLFLLLGVSIYVPILKDQWQAVLIGIAAVLVARAISVYGGLSLLGYTMKNQRIPYEQQTQIVWGGIKGTVTVVLFFSLPGELDYSYTIQAVVYGVVLFSLFVQATTLRVCLKKC